MKKLFIGIDYSKQNFSASAFEMEKKEDVYYGEFENNSQGFSEFFKWLKSLTSVEKDQWLVCGEHTGIYSIELSGYLLKKDIFVWLENPLQIKRSSGIKREKTDKTDSLDIAIYAYRFQDKAKLFELPEKCFTALQNLLAFRERLIRNKCTLETSANEMRAIYKRDETARYIYEQSHNEIQRIRKEIKQIEKKMLEIVKQSEHLNKNYHLAVSVKGIGLINALTILVCTQNFTLFDNYRQFSCYGGTAPFDHSSGSSLHKGKHVSKLANIKIKTLLTQAARSAVVHDPQIRDYYLRKIAEGKHKHIALNNVRNKLISRVFAVVRNKQAYRNDFLNPMAC